MSQIDANNVIVLNKLPTNHFHCNGTSHSLIGQQAVITLKIFTNIEFLGNFYIFISAEQVRALPKNTVGNSLSFFLTESSTSSSQYVNNLYDVKVYLNTFDYLLVNFTRFRQENYYSLWTKACKTF